MKRADVEFPRIAWTNRASRGVGGKASKRTYQFDRSAKELIDAGTFNFKECPIGHVDVWRDGFGGLTQGNCNRRTDGATLW